MRNVIAVAICLAGLTTQTHAQDVMLKKNFGGNDYDCYQSVTAVSNGIVAVGYSHPSSFNTGDWTGVAAKGSYDAIVVKYDNAGNVAWKKSFGGSGGDYYYSVTAVSDGFVAVGLSSEASFNTGDWVGVAGKGGWDAIIVKYNNNGDVVWKKNFGGSDNDVYNSVTVVSNGFVAVGYSRASFGNGDWTGVTSKGSNDAIIVKYDNNGNVVWKKNFGGSGDDVYNSVTVVSDGIVAVGSSAATSFGNGDWTGYWAGIEGKGGDDAILVKYDNTGNIVWKNNFGGSGGDSFMSVTATSDDYIVAVGYSYVFDTGDWTGYTGKGLDDAIIVKFDYSGGVQWKNNFGGSGDDTYQSVMAVSDGFVVAGYSMSSSFGNGDWTGVTGKGSYDAVMVKYDDTLNLVWKKNFGGSDDDIYYSATAVSDGIVAVGYSTLPSFNTGDWNGVTGKGGADAIMVKHLVPVANITGIPAMVLVGAPVTLTGTVTPIEASYKNIVWSVASAGTTGAVITGNQLFVTAAGTAVITATIINGTAMGSNFTKSFYINATTTPVCSIGSTNYPSLETALAAITTNAHTTIKLLENITTVDEIDIYDRKITFDLNGKNLIFGNTIWLGENSVIDYTGTGNFKSIVNITIPDNRGFLAIYVFNGSTLKLMSVDVNIMGGTHQDALGIICYNSSTVIVDGDVKVISSEYPVGIEASQNSTITINGSITAAYAGVFAGDGTGTSTVTIKGNVNSANGYGVQAIDPAVITIDGKINAADYILLNNIPYIAAEGVTDPTKPGYLKYANGSTTVWVGNKTVGIDDVQADNLTIYPNPVKDELKIDMSDMRYAISDIQILDISSKIIVSNLISHISNPISINVSALPQGIYFLKIETDKGIVTKKFVKK